MPRKARKLSSSGVYHIMTRGIDKTRVMLDDADCIQFLCFLNFVQNEGFQVLAYCLMGNHVHLLVKTDKANIDALELAMKRLLVRYVAYYNRKYDRVGGLFQNRYASQPVVTTGYFTITLLLQKSQKRKHNMSGAAIETILVDAKRVCVKCRHNMLCKSAHWNGLKIGTRKAS